MRAAEDHDALRAEREALSRSAQDNDARSRAMRPQIDRPAATAAGPEAFPADSARAADMAKMTQTAEMPVAQDRGLKPEHWIERIRLRRDSGDIAGARESLQLLRREYPQTLIPSDLVELTEPQP